MNDEIKASTIDDNANEMKMSNKQQKGTTNKVFDDPKDCNDKERNELKDKGKTKQHVSLENLDDSKGCAFNKPLARTNSAHKVQTISMTNLVLFSILFGLAGARTLENLDSNELVKETPSWVTPIMKGTMKTS